MHQLTVGLFLLSILVIGVQSKIVNISIDLTLLLKKSPEITKWIAGILLAMILKSLFQ